MSKFYSAETQQGHSTHFFNYIRTLAEANSKQEGDQLIDEDLKNLRAVLTSSTSKDEELLKEYAVRAYYAELLGHSAEFAYIHCINLACHRKLNYKRTGYLATGLMVNPESELMYLIVSSVQRDLQSPNYLEAAAALSAATKMLRPELITVVQADVVKLLTHEKPLVRRKAVEAMHAFFVRTDGATGDIASFRQALCDRDPSVMDAATRLLYTVIQRSPDTQRDLLDSFIMILSQVIERRLPRTYDYHRMPAPWLQIRVIQLLTLLVGNDVHRAEKAGPVLEEAMQRADNGKIIGFAVICELIRTAAAIPALPKLLSLAAEAVSGLITARNPSLRCAGIQALSHMVRVRPDLAEDHQEVVMSCLEDADETIRRKTIWLLFAICRPDNIGPIARRLIRFIGKISDPFLKRTTTRGVCRLMEQYAVDPWWYIKTMNRVLAVAAECVLPATIQRMLKLIAEGQGTDEQADTAFRIRCVETYFYITGGSATGDSTAGSPAASPDASIWKSASHAAKSDSQPVPELLRRIGVWVMGEYGFLSSRVSAEMLLDRLCDVMEQTEDAETRCWILSAMVKVTAQLKINPQQQHSTSSSSLHRNGSGPFSTEAEFADDLVAQFCESHSIPLQQRCYEYAVLRKDPALMRRVLPVDGFCEEVDPDPEMHFLDGFVEEAVARGARRYSAPADISTLRRQRELAVEAARAESVLRTAAYVPTGPMNIQPTWSAAATTAGGIPVTRSAGTEDVMVASNAGLTQSVLQGTERLVLQPTATTRWGVQNVREMEAAEAEVQLQVAAAAAVGGGGIVWGAGTVLAEPPSAQQAVNAPVATSPAPFTERTGAAVGGSGAGTEGDRGSSVAVSSKNAKFARSIFGGGRRKGNAPTFASTVDVAAPTAPSCTPAHDGVAMMDSLFTSDASPAHAPVDPTASWFSDHPVTASASSSAVAGSALMTSLRPASAAVDTVLFGQQWQVRGSSVEASGKVRFPNLSDFAAPEGALQCHLRRACALRVVQVIGKELIAAAEKSGGTSETEFILAHITVLDGSTISVMVRAARKEVSAEVLRVLQFI